MSKPSYKFLFHYSEYRPKETAWAYFHEEDQTVYKNGLPTSKFDTKKGKRIVFGSTPDECVKTAIKNNLHD